MNRKLHRVDVTPFGNGFRVRCPQCGWEAHETAHIGLRAALVEHGNLLAPLHVVPVCGRITMRDGGVLKMTGPTVFVREEPTNTPSAEDFFSALEIEEGD